MTLEELSVTFSADTRAFNQRMGELSQLMDSMAGEADRLSGAFQTAGAQAGAGLAQGLISKESAVRSAAARIARIAEEALRGALDIHSPSRVTEEIGRRFDEGFARGIEGGQNDVARQSSAVAYHAAETLTTQNPSGETLNMDVVCEMITRAVRDIRPNIYLDGTLLSRAAQTGESVLKSVEGR